MLKKWITLVSALLLSACMSTPPNVDQAQKASSPSRAGTGQVMTIKPGDSKQSVLEKLGGPEIITSSEDGGELWVYDKLSATVEAESGRTGLFSSAAVVVSSKKTMMTTIYFDSDGLVVDVKYRVSRY